MKLKTLPQEEEACSVGLSRPQANCAPSHSDERQLSFPAPTPSFLLYISRAESRTSEKQHEENMRAGQEAQHPELTHTRETQGVHFHFSTMAFAGGRMVHGVAWPLFLVTLSVKALVLCGNGHR